MVMGCSLWVLRALGACDIAHHVRDFETNNSVPHVNAVSVTHRVPPLPRHDDQNVREYNTASVTFLA